LQQHGWIVILIRINCILIKEWALNKAHILTTVIILVITGCAGMDYVRDAPERINQTDWSTMQMVTVSLTEHSFSPPRLVFKRNTPYKLEIKNTGKEKHYFVSEGFFKAVALRKVQSADGEVKAPYLTAIEVYPERFMELYFVPISPLKRGHTTFHAP
jgi:hypothetical protein